MRLLAKIADRFVDWWMRRCRHDGGHVASDILEGGGGGIEIPYCRRCGSVGIRQDGRIQRCGDDESRAWRRPRPLWFGSI